MVNSVIHIATYLHQDNCCSHFAPSCFYYIGIST